MLPERFVHECTLGGPGLDGYAYRADLYCVRCGEVLAEALAARVAPSLTGTEDPFFSDSETVPCPVFFGEHEEPQFCCRCADYLYGGNLE